MGGDELTLKGSFHATFSPASNKLITGRIMFDTGIIISHMHQQQESGGSSQRKNEESCNDVAAAADVAAASKAAVDILDSLQMPHMVAFKNNNVYIVPASCSGSSSGDSSDESINDRGGASSNHEVLVECQGQSHQVRDYLENSSSIPNHID